MRRAQQGILLAAVLAFSARPSQAEPAPYAERVKFTWHDASPTSCLDPRALAERIERELGRPVFVRANEPPANVELKVEVLVLPADAIELQLELLRDGERMGGRTLHGSAEHCTELFDSSVVVMALLVDAPREADAEPLPRPRSPARASTAAPQSTVHSVRPGRRVTGLEFGAHAVWNSGLLPDSAWGASLDARAALAVWPWLALRLGGAYFPRGEGVTEAGSAELRAATLSFGLSLVRFQSGARVRIEPWLLAGADGVGARGQGFTQNHQGTRWFAATGLGLRGEVRLAAHLALSAEGVAWLALARPRFLYQRLDGSTRELYRPARALASLQLGLVWNFL